MISGQGQSHLLPVAFSDAFSKDKSSLLLGDNFVYVANFLISLPLLSVFIAKYHLKLSDFFFFFAVVCF